MSHDPTKYGIQSNVKIPPESTGERILHSKWYVLTVAGLGRPLANVPANAFNNAGIDGFVVECLQIPTSTAYRMLFMLRETSLDNIVPGIELEVDEGDTSVTVTVLDVQVVQTPAIHISGANNPSHRLNVDKFGAAYTRFSEGSQQLDPKGLTRVSTPYSVLDCKFVESTNDAVAYAKATGTASQTYMANQRLLAMDIGVDANDRIIKRTNRRAFFQGGFSQNIDTMVAVGDSGKADVVRRWGYYNDTDGLFFELDGTQLYFVIRTSTYNVPQGQNYYEIRIPQHDWNLDTLDGTNGKANPSNITLRPEFMNHYFIDFTTNTAAKIRFGIYGPNGRVVCHDQFFGNTISQPLFRTAMLPMTWELFNKAATGSPSRLTTLGGTVLNEGFLTPDSNIMIANPATYAMGSMKEFTGSQFGHLISVRASKTKPDGSVNDRTVVPQKLMYHVEGGPVIVQVRVGMVLNDSAFTRGAVNSVAEVDTDATFPSNPLYQGLPLMTRVYAEGSHIVDPPPSFNIRGNGVSLRSDGEYGTVYSWTIKPVNPTDTVRVWFGADWVDV